jgi:hypothetical protein
LELNPADRRSLRASRSPLNPDSDYSLTALYDFYKVSELKSEIDPITGT